MILRVLDFYNDFHCIADKCKHSCCIGWEIDIDEDTYDYYRSIPGSLGRRLLKNMAESDEGDHCFQLAEGGRCPFLNDKNLCDICAELGEEALSEVCTEYPRFPIGYKNVIQNSLTLSCEEVGRLVFTHQDPMEILDLEMPGEEEDDGEEDPRILSLAEEGQRTLITILQDREKSFEDRIREASDHAKEIQEKLNDTETEAFSGAVWQPDRQASLDRLEVFERMGIEEEEWDAAKKKLHAFYGDREEPAGEAKTRYEQAVRAYLSSPDHREADYEHLLVYFVFRYAMTAAADGNFLSKWKLALEFTLFIRDMAAERYRARDGHFSTEDMIDVARIFSKAVEHAEENIIFAEEEL